MIRSLSLLHIIRSSTIASLLRVERSDSDSIVFSPGKNPRSRASLLDLEFLNFRTSLSNFSTFKYLKTTNSFVTWAGLRECREWTIFPPLSSNILIHSSVFFSRFRQSQSLGSLKRIGSHTFPDRHEKIDAETERRTKYLTTNSNFSFSTLVIGYYRNEKGFNLAFPLFRRKCSPDVAK